MEKQYKATQKYLLESPRKLRLVVEVIKKMKPADAVEKLPFLQKRAAGNLAKVIKSAIASAKIAGIADTDLIFKEIQIGEGPRLKRGRAASRGMWHPYKKRMAHIRVVLTTVQTQNSNLKSQNKEAKSEINSKESNVKDEAGVDRNEVEKKGKEKKS